MFIAGDGDTVTPAPGATAGVSGANDIVQGNGNTITILGASTLTVAGTGDTFVFRPTPGSSSIAGYDASDIVQFSPATFADWSISRVPRASRAPTPSFTTTRATP